MNFKIAAANLLISQFFILIFFIFAYFTWFPHSLSEFSGFSNKVQLITIVNIVLGPILILIVYKKNKKSLTFDLTILFSLQVLAIAYGAYTLYLYHPSYAVFTVDRFTLVYPSESEQEKIRYTKLKTSILSKTKLTFAKFPQSIASKNELIMTSMMNPEKDLDKRHEYFEPYTNHIQAVIDKSIDTNQLFFSKKSQIKLRNFLNKYTGGKDDYLYLPLQSSSKDVVWVLDKNTAQPIGIIVIDPWL